MPPFEQPRFDQREDLFVEERVARRILERLGEVGEDRAVTIAAIAHERQRIADDDVRPRIVERAGRPFRKKLFGSSITRPSISTIVARPTSGATQDFAQRRALAAAEDQHLGAIGGRRERGVHEALVIDPLVDLRALRVAVDDEHLAEDRRAQHRDLLKLRAPREEQLVDRVTMLLGGRELFDVPLPVLRLGHARPRLAAKKQNPAVSGRALFR